MKKFFTVLVLSCLFAGPVLAESLSIDQGRAVALKKFPGRIVGAYKSEGEYRYKIKPDDGMIVVVSVDSESGIVTHTEVQRYARGEDMPEPKITRKEMIRLVKDKMGRMASIRKIEVVVLDGKLVYKNEVRSNKKNYDVIVDAMTGAIVLTERN